MMADIQSRILSEYGIDIAQEDILKIYKINSADLSPEELEQKISDTRKRLNGSVNGANEKLAERARGRLEKAPKYEEILRDNKLRKELFQYYKDPSGGDSKNESSSGNGNTAFAKEFFQLVGTTKKVNKKDIEFYFKYFQTERKNKKVILEMLEKDLKIRGVGSEHTYADENETVDEEGKKKKDDSPLIVSLFTEATILKVHRVIEKYGEILQNETVKNRYPELEQGLYQFLKLDQIENAEQFSKCMTERGKEAYAVRQEHGAEYVPLVDLFNILQTLGEYQDVSDNIPAFKLLIQYPNLTPYMYSFVNMKPVTVEEITDIANRDYEFRDQTDFILTYYNPIHKNFGITDSGIAAILKRAEQSAKKNKVLNEVDEKLGRDKNKKIPIWAEMIHWLVYWPIFIIYLVFETAKAIFTEIHKFALPAGAFVFIVTNWLLPPIVELENLAVFRKFFLKNQWLSYLYAFFKTDTTNWFEIILLSLILIGLTLVVYIIPAGAVTTFLYMFADDFNKRFDWDGLERTFQQVFMKMRRKTEEMYFASRNTFVKKRIPKIIINLISLVVLLFFLHYAAGGLKTWSGNIHLGARESASESSYDTENPGSGEVPEEAGAPEGRRMVITASSANIRSGPGTDYPVLTTAGQGNTFVATGNEETASNGRIWYEIYINDEQTGWASQKVIAFQ